MKKILFITLSLFYSYSLSFAGYYDEGKEGWYWYEKEEDQEEKKDEKTTMLEKEVAESLALANRKYKTKDLWNMHPIQFQKILEAKRQRSIQTGDLKHAEAYLKMQDMAVRKAHAFMSVGGYIIDQKQKQSYELAYPIEMQAKNARVSQELDRVKTELRKYKSKYALIYFYSPYCPACEAFEGIIEVFKKRHRGYIVKRVNVNEFPEYANSLGVQATPSMMLLSRKTEKVSLLTAGVITVKKLERRIIQHVYLLEGKRNHKNYFLKDTEKGGPFDPLYYENDESYLD